MTLLTHGNFIVLPHWETRPPMIRFVCLLFYVLVTSKVISQRVLTCENTQSSWIYSVVPLGDEATSTMTRYPTQSPSPVTEPNTPCPIQIMLCAWLGSDKYQILSQWFDSTRVWSNEDRITEVWIPNLPKWEIDALLIRPGHSNKYLLKWTRLQIFRWRINCR